MKKSLIAAPVVGIALAISLTGCGKHGSTATSASASAEKQTAEKYVSKCVPQNSLAQIQLAKGLAASADNRDKLAKCLGIPPDQRQNFEAAALAQAEHTKWTPGAVHQFLEVALPNLALQYQAKK